MTSKQTGVDTDLPLAQYPNIHWEKFCNRFSEIKTINITDWSVVHILAYFISKYEEHYCRKYTIKFNSTAPGKSYEVFQIRKLAYTLSTEPIILKAYIDWFFERKIANKNITSMAYFTDTNVINDYKLNHLMINKNSSVDRTTKLPPYFIEIINNFGKTITTYGDLAFISKCMEAGNLTDPKYKQMLTELQNNGLNLNALSTVR